MRIVAGKWRGRPLIAPPSDATRPTTDRTREALFSMLTSRLGNFEGLSVADLFAGTGALGLEALSRGAARVTFVEKDRSALAALNTNIDKLGARGEAEVRPQTVEALGAVAAPYDLLLMDPPYGEGAGAAALTRLSGLGWIAPASWISLETRYDEAVELPGFTVEAERVHGKAKITLLRIA